MTDCDFIPRPNPAPLATITPHAIRIEPIRTGWRAWTKRKGDLYPVKRIGLTPRAALTALVQHVPDLPGVPFPCARCATPNADIAYSAPGDNRLHWYCVNHEPRMAAAQ